MDAQINAHEVEPKRRVRAPSQAKRPRSAITSGRSLFIDGDPRSAWSRRFSDLVVNHIRDLNVGDLLSEAQVSLIKRCASIECELERLDAMLSRGKAIDLDAYARVSGQLRRLFETLHTINLARRPPAEMSLGQLLLQEQQP